MGGEDVGGAEVGGAMGPACHRHEHGAVDRESLGTTQEKTNCNGQMWGIPTVVRDKSGYSKIMPIKYVCTPNHSKRKFWCISDTLDVFENLGTFTGRTAPRCAGPPPNNRKCIPLLL